jgi:flavodoxin
LKEKGWKKNLKRFNFPENKGQVEWQEEFTVANNLILYYSRKGENYVNGTIKNLSKGNTEIVAEFIQNAVGGDLFQVDTVERYADDYHTCTEEAKKELHNNARPELRKYLDSIEEYDNIFVCGPCWWGTFPMAIFSQLERLDFTGKKVMAVMTHEGSGLGSCERDLKKLCTGATFGKSLAVHGADAAKSQRTVTDWAKQAITK